MYYTFAILRKSNLEIYADNFYGGKMFVSYFVSWKDYENFILAGIQGFPTGIFLTNYY